MVDEENPPVELLPATFAAPIDERTLSYAKISTAELFDAEPVELSGLDGGA